MSIVYIGLFNWNVASKIGELELFLWPDIWLGEPTFHDPVLR